MIRRLPPLNALRAFEAAARHLSFTEAAAELFVTQGAISRQVQALEDHFQAPLFHRTHRRIALTEHGRALLPVLTDAFDRIAQASDRVRGSRRDLRVKVPVTFALRLLIPRLHRFQERYPDVHVRLTTASDPIDFAHEDFDAAIAYSEGRPLEPGEVADRLFVERMTVVAAPSFLAAGPPLRVPADLRGRRLILNTPDGWDWRRWAEATGVTDLDFDSALVFDIDDHALQAAARGHGVALAALQLIRDDLDRGRLVAPLAAPSVAMGEYRLVYPAANAGRTRLIAFRDWLLAEFAG